MDSSLVYQRIVHYSALHRRLQLGHLPQPLRGYAVGIVGVALVSCLIIALAAFGLYPWETTFSLPENLSPIPAPLSVPFSLVVALLLGLGLVAGALYYGSYQPGWPLPFPTRLTVGILGTALPLHFLDYSLLTTSVWDGLGLIWVPLYLQFAFVLLAIGCGAATVVCSFITSPRVARWGPRFGAGPYFFTALTFLMFKLWWDFLTRQGQLNSDTIHMNYLPITTLIAYLTPLVWMIGIIFFWQAITEVKLISRDIGLKVAAQSERAPWLLAALFALKIVWLLAGYWGAARGAAGEIWEGSVGDGPVAWLLATLFAAATGWWLAQRRRPVDAAQLGKGALFLTGGFLLPFVSAFILFFPATLLTSLGTGEVGLFLATISSRLADVGYFWSFLFTSILLPLGLALLRWQRFRYLAPLLLLAGLWSLPAVIQGLLPNTNVSFEYLTYDVTLTFTLLALALLAWRGKKHTADTWIISLVLVVSTLVALAESLLPPDQAYLGFALFLVVPMLYQLFFDSAELNVVGVTQGQRIIRTIGLQAGLMLVVASALVLGLISPGENGMDAVANKIFLPPLLALFLADTISNRAGTSFPAPTDTE